MKVGYLKDGVKPRSYFWQCLIVICRLTAYRLKQTTDPGGDNLDGATKLMFFHKVDNRLPDVINHRPRQPGICPDE